MFAVGNSLVAFATAKLSLISHSCKSFCLKNQYIFDMVDFQRFILTKVKGLTKNWHKWDIFRNFVGKFFAMKKLFCAAAMALSLAVASADEPAGHLVILHTNDTHSRIDPMDNGRGGLLRRKVVIDSVRAAEPEVLLIDAGDAVQGTLYFSLFGGEVERKLMNALGYDIQILGNHEFDNGMESLARQWSQLNAEKLSTNYDVRGSKLEGILKPYTVREVGGRKIGFLAINLDPDGMISAANSRGVAYLDGIKAANAMAWYLRNIEHCDLVIAISHIGYAVAPGYVDLDLARASEDIDIIIGGHSHTLVDPANPAGPSSKVANADGDSILVAQAGALGAWVGKIDIDLADLTTDYSVIAIDGRLDDRIDPSTAAILEPYRHDVDSILTLKVGYAATPLVKEDWGLINFVTDFVGHRGGELTDRKIDLALMNRGGIRCDMPKGSVTQGLLMQMLPFDNRVVVIELSGRDLLEAFDVMASRGGDGVSGNVRAEFDSETRKCTDVRIDGRPIDPDKIYTVATIDYLALGGDFLRSLKNGKEIARSNRILYDDFIDYFKNGPMKRKKAVAKPGSRMVSKP